jgi:predicted unusual protein kinase regulating ubiquinone biosynthesis (AarF/ABC1/UbiB family)
MYGDGPLVSSTLRSPDYNLPVTSPGRIRGSRFSRSAALLAAAGRGAARSALAHVMPGQREQRQEQAMLRTADDVARVMGNMKGVMMKLGQILSLMGGAVPEGFAERMTSLQAAAPPMAPELVRKVFIEDLGRPPEKLFRRFEPRPFAAASIGQVHLAELADRTPVAVKVQYPGIKDAISADLANLGVVFGLAGVAARGFDPGPMVEDLRQGITDELNYRLEASRQQRFRDLYDGHPFIRIPAVYPDLGSERILVQEFIEGAPFSAARSLPEDDKNRIAEMIFRFTFGSMHRHGLFQADPHAGNYLLLQDGTVAFLDFGCIAEFEPRIMTNIHDLITGVLTDDLERWRRGLEQVGYVPHGADLTTDELWEQMRIYYSFILEDGVTFTPELASAMVRQNLALTGETGRINRQLNIPQGVVFTQRITFGFAGLMATIRATGPWRSITEEYVLDKPPSTELGRLSAAHSPVAWA